MPICRACTRICVAVRWTLAIAVYDACPAPMKLPLPDQRLLAPAAFTGHAPACVAHLHSQTCPGAAPHSCTTPVYVSGPCMPTVPLPHVALQPAGAAAVGRTGRTGRVVGTRFAAPTPQDGHRVCLPPAAKCD